VVNSIDWLITKQKVKSLKSWQKKPSLHLVHKTKLILACLKNMNFKSSFLIVSLSTSGILVLQRNLFPTPPFFPVGILEMTLRVTTTPPTLPTSRVAAFETFFHLRSNDEISNKIKDFLITVANFERISSKWIVQKRKGWLVKMHHDGSGRYVQNGKKSW